MDPEFVVTRHEAGRLDFDVRAEWSPRIRTAFFASGADGLVANYARGFVGRDLDFVRELPLRRLNVLGRGITDLTPVHDLAGTLEELSVEVAPGAHVDLALLPGLRVLACAWDQVRDSIERTDRLEDLYLAPYRERDLAPLTHLTALRSLRMKERPGVRSLDGIESMSWLAHLGIYGAPLEDTSALVSLGSPVLTELALATCPRLTSLSDLSSLVGLRHLDVSESGPLQSLGPIADSILLEGLYLYGSTTIVDGDLTPLRGLTRLTDLRMMARRHYTPTLKDVRRHLGIDG